MVKDLAALRELMPVLLGEQGEVTGIKGRVRGVLRGAQDKYVRPEDRGCLLFVSSMSAVQRTREAEWRTGPASWPSCAGQASQSARAPCAVRTSGRLSGRPWAWLDAGR